MRLALILVLFTLPSAAQTGGLQGRWRTPTGAVVEIMPCSESICAVIRALDPNPPSRVDNLNPDPALRTRSVCNLQIGSGFHLSDPSHADGGRLYDPKSGKTYSGKMTAEGNTLHLRGYVLASIFGRTETWTRLPTTNPLAPCH